MNELEKFLINESRMFLVANREVDRCIFCGGHKHNTVQVIVQMEIDGQAQFSRARI